MATLRAKTATVIHFPNLQCEGPRKEGRRWGTSFLRRCLRLLQCEGPRKAWRPDDGTAECVADGLTACNAKGRGRHGERQAPRLLNGDGVRVQESVFECDLEEDALAYLQRRLQEELSRKPGGDVRVYRACANCLQASWGLGEVEEGLGGEPFIVV